MLNRLMVGFELRFGLNVRFRFRCRFIIVKFDFRGWE
jgi:hypothetical protein